MKIILRYPPRLRHHKLEGLWYQLRYCKYEFECDDVRDKLDDAVDWVLLKYQRYVCNPVNRFIEKIWMKDTIRIDYQDLWSLDDSLSKIIHPSLVALQKIKHGSASVDDADVPHMLEQDTHERWEWVLGEMIWAFAQIANEGSTDEFYHNRDQLQMVTTPLPDNPKLHSLGFNHQKDLSKPKYWVDYEGLKIHEARIDNGLRLFGKYYRGLWD